jgi:hypothetical protein
MRAARIAVLTAALLPACGDRLDVYDKDIERPVPSFALESEVALIDDSAHRVVVLSPGPGQSLARTSIAVGHNVVHGEVSRDRRRLVVLAAGDLPRRKVRDERPSLTLIEQGASRRLELETPHSGFSLDPEGRYIALYAAPNAGESMSFVENPNEIVVVDLESGQITPRTLRSFGGRPQRVSFTPRLELPGGGRRLLVVETDQDVALLDLDQVRAIPERPEITVRLTAGTDAIPRRPAAIVVDDGDGGRNDDARIAVRMVNDPNVITLTLGPTEIREAAEPGTVPNDFGVTFNLTDVGGPPGDIAFVRTDAGLRLVAVVPSTRSAVLVDPSSSVTTTVVLPEPYSRISLITDVVGGTSGSDTALLFGSGGSRGVAFWSLGRATGEQPFRSLEVIPLAVSIDGLLDVPPPRPELKVLQAAGQNQFFALNLASRTAAPLTTLGTPSLHVAPDGERLWAFQRGSSQLAQVMLSDLHPIPLPIDRSIEAVYDVRRADGGRALVAIDPNGGVGATVLDAFARDTATARSYYGLLLEDLR